MLFALACLAMGFHIIELSNTEIMTASSIDHMYWTFGTLLILSSIFFGSAVSRVVQETIERRNLEMNIEQFKFCIQNLGYRKMQSHLR